MIDEPQPRVMNANTLHEESVYCDTQRVYLDLRQGHDVHLRIKSRERLEEAEKLGRPQKRASIVIPQDQIMPFFDAVRKMEAAYIREGTR